MTEAPISNAGLIEIAKKFLDFKYIALDSSATAYLTSQTGPLNEINSNGGQRSMGSATHNASAGVVTITKQFVFTGQAIVKAICPMTSGTMGQGAMLTRYLPGEGQLPDSFNDGGSLLVTLTCSVARPA